jgi:GH43 family beta-xylosidase
LVACPTVSLLAPAAAQANDIWTPAHPGDFPDPDVLQVGDEYYAFATQNFASAADTVNVQVSTSSNGVNWSSTSQDALPTLPSWAEVGDTWAPSVAFNGVGYVMYYAATETRTGDQCIGRAISASPLGPYVDNETAPFMCQNGVDTPANDNYGGSIDPDIFMDNGNPYLIWKSDGNHLSPALNTYIWSMPLTSNLLSANGAPLAILADDEAWQGGIVEGPDMVSNNGVDYLFYSGSDEGTSTYGIGYAVCPYGPNGACQDMSTYSPLLATQPGMSGPGGPSVFTSPTGATEMAFAAWQGTTIGYLNCAIRPMYVASLTFTASGGDPIPSLSPAIATNSPAGNPSCYPPSSDGYWQVAADGGIFTFGAAQFYGSTGSLRLNKPVVGMAATPDGKGYWLVASDGGIFAFGDANFYGSTGSLRLDAPIVAMLPTLDGKGYWLVASDGGVFAFGDAVFYGSLGGDHLSTPITAVTPGYLDGGYLLSDAAGQVFAFGDAKYEGGLSSAPGGYRVVGMGATHDDDGYWLASANGNVVGEGDAAPYGSMYGTNLNAPIVGLSTTSDQAGYWLQGSDGGIFCFGDAMFLGSMGGQHLNAPMVGIATM